MRKTSPGPAAYAPKVGPATRPKGKPMKQVAAIATFLAGGLAFASPAAAVTSLVADGITYTLNLDSISSNDLTAFFTFTISGENTASDTEGGVNAGRTGINAIAFSNPSGAGATAGAMTSPTGFSFSLAGLNSSGCNNSQANFFCFDNSAIPPIPTTPLSGPLSFAFNVTVGAADAGVWEKYALPDMKIDWVGTANNYDLVSQAIPVNDERNPTPNSITPEPATWAMMLIGFGFIGSVMRRRKQPQLVQFS